MFGKAISSSDRAIHSPPASIGRKPSEVADSGTAFFHTAVDTGTEEMRRGALSDGVCEASGEDGVRFLYQRRLRQAAAQRPRDGLLDVEQVGGDRSLAEGGAHVVRSGGHDMHGRPFP
jgi:hypothetical protein